MTMRKLTYKTVFSKYEKPVSQKLARTSYSFYKTVRQKTSKLFPLKKHERFLFDDHYLPHSSSSDMPRGYDYSLKQETDGFVKLEYIDFFDYLPKEDIEAFKRKLRRFALANKKTMFSPFRTKEDDDRINNMGRYVDGRAFSNLHVAEFLHNDYLARYASYIEISIRNLSPSFIVVKYRVYISRTFNEKLDSIYKKKYEPYSDVSIPYYAHWFQPKRFGRSLYTGDDARKKEIYSELSQLKWNVYCEIRKFFNVYFINDQMFFPTFETYSTNIRPNSEKSNREFWSSIGLSADPDYSQSYNACVGWPREVGNKEGMKILAFCGGNYTQNDSLPEIAEHSLSDIYSVYIVAKTIQRIVERDIALCNKRISKAVRSAKPVRLLKLRASIERKLYYGYRFLSEFSGESVEKEDSDAFCNTIIKTGSITKRALYGVADSIVETKKQIDVLLHLLDDAAEFESSSSNMKLQWIMAIITVLSLVIAVVALSDFSIDFGAIWEWICELPKRLKT